jgi:hypothetical protein
MMGEYWRLWDLVVPWLSIGKGAKWDCTGEMVREMV